MDRDPIRRDPVQEYGDGLAVVTVTRSVRPDVDRIVGSVRVATTRPVRIVLAAVGQASAVCGDTTGADGMEVLRIGEDIGRAAAVNRAVAGLDAGVGWVAIADPGVRWGAGVLDGLLATAAGRPRAGLLGPRLRAAAGAVVASAGALPSITQALHGRIPTAACAGPTGWLSTSCVLVRRSAWDSVDGFDPRYLGAPGPVDVADVDLGDRLDRAGWLLVHVPGLEIDTEIDTVVDTEAGVDAHDGHGILTWRADDLRRYLHDRGRAPVRALLALGGRAGRA
ncbi:dTDP-Rha--alpha-D-GlcNAc-pyrophosphate polyprenol alpha-3-L-rhamnosyltransferase [Pseudonocardia sp.]|uniref:dTDP-Rha--alpha-D-GlcNAc-pyrophosphate polyprenol alpha-3-L-rhamnosyltransferase n=1 Tax=Pseudonocardia sp. TaxID=60912 RepID=UPI002D94C40B|nr:dTDP-Rha--alpha-D-GlcNAc-pyrophosphate polyprenol alpha-3-L-rhamnosyltransferase [Pseudonocardia sp.]